MGNIQASLWDPTGGKVDSTSFLLENGAIIEKVNNYKRHPYLVRFILIACSLIPLAAIGSFFLFQYFDLRVLLVSFIPFVFYYQYLVNLQNELILYLLCEEN